MDFLSSSFPSLVYLNLTNNRWISELPNDLYKLNNLRTLDLSNNLLFGSIPNSMGSMIELTNLFLNGNSLIGTIPRSFNSLLLSNVDISSNGIVGPLPPLTNWSETLSYCNLGFICYDQPENIPVSCNISSSLLPCSYPQASQSYVAWIVIVVIFGILASSLVCWMVWRDLKKISQVKRRWVPLEDEPELMDIRLEPYPNIITVQANNSS